MKILLILNLYFYLIAFYYIHKNNYDEGAQVELIFFRKYKGKNEKFKISRNWKAIGKKIKVVNEVSTALGLTNIKAEHMRAELVKEEFDFIVSRAVTKMDDFVKWTKGKIAKKQRHELKNGILYLKGGDLTEELQNFPKATQYDLTDFFDEDFFETKKVVHIPLKKR